ncbi:N-terminal glutamine amidase, putative [Bodo saltans]|uniref:Protein N-terminal glutamine amidohydrolase n=1 Tax=Bodo saltans TaxID=75058 RepID=A0A0S4INY8_BODSA|nr:N-terminal glutamine amidase, putative [Bodo saltans]|eukprot:CUF75175.1 N-terminal glutamine amidase, putative [Bodo saltans]
MEVAQRKRAAAATTDGNVPSSPATTVGPSPPAFIDVDPTECSAACAFFVSTYHEDAVREKKNRWESQFPICTVDVARVITSTASSSDASTTTPAGGDADSSDTKPPPNAVQQQYRGGDPFVLWDYHVIAMIWSRPHGAWFVVDLDSKIGLPSTEPILPDTLLRAIRADLYIKIAFYPDVAVHRRLTQHNVAHLAKMSERIWMRVINAVDYLATFRSDRSHMLRKPLSGRSLLRGDEAYNSPPPKYQCIVGPSFVVNSLRPVVPATTNSGEEPESTAPPPTGAAWAAESNLASFINMKNTTTVPGVPMPRDVFLEWISDKHF